jgi:hypothetical protein
MAKADRVLSTPPTNTPIRAYLFEGTAIAFILIAGGIVSSLIAVQFLSFEQRLAAQCSQQKTVRP